MRKLLLGLILAAVGLYSAWVFAQAPTSAPSARYFLGPTLGEQWRPARSLTAGIDAQTGTSYTILATDAGKLVTFNNGSAVAVTLPQTTGNFFPANTTFSILNLGAGTVTVTPGTSTINGATTKTYAQNAGGDIVSDGTNYFAW